MAYRYRDTVTGKLVNVSTWKRSHAHDGMRYVREKIHGAVQRQIRRVKVVRKLNGAVKKTGRRTSARGSRPVKVSTRPRKKTAQRVERAQPKRRRVSKPKEGARRPARKKIAPKKGKRGARRRRRGGRRRAPLIMHMVQIDIRDRRGHKYGSRDLLIPAPKNVTLPELRLIAEETLPGRARALAQFIDRHSQISEGPHTRARRAQVR